jgi:hypothetical protein
MALLVTAACARSVPPEEVPGTYVMNRGKAADTLVVRADRMYVRRYAAPGRPMAIDSGTWSPDHVGSSPMLGFQGFPMRWEVETSPDGRDTARVLWLVSAQRDARGGVRLLVDEDLDWAYIRVAAR